MLEWDLMQGLAQASLAAPSVSRPFEAAAPQLGHWGRGMMVTLRHRRNTSIPEAIQRLPLATEHLL